MTTQPTRIGAGWLALREPADAAARAVELVAEVRARLPADRVALVHDLGCGTGAMARWLAPRLPGPQHWVMHDHDHDLLALAAADPPVQASDGATITVETRWADVTRLGDDAVASAALITASALLDVLTTHELGRLLAVCAGPGCPILISLTVTGHVELTPRDPFDEAIRQAFNDHQRRLTPAGRLLGPEAVRAAADELTSLGCEVRVRPSPWRLGPGQAGLMSVWLQGWVGAACEQVPELGHAGAAYSQRRAADLAAGRLSVVVHHEDLLALPR
jgi:hypothetical protein